jgi:hypothetical protein
MKKNNILFTIAFIPALFLLSVMSSCTSGSADKADGQTDFRLAIADTIIQQYNALRPEWDLALSTVGNVTIVLNEDHIEIQHTGENAHELMSYFVLTGDNKHDLEASAFGRAEVIYLDRALIVNSLERRKTLFFHIETDNKPDYLKDIKGVKTYGGFGIGLRKINYGSQPDQPPYCGCQSANVPPANCKSGGVMDMTCASSNEHGSCRVSCSGQTYACCDKDNAQPQ